MPGKCTQSLLALQRQFEAGLHYNYTIITYIIQYKTSMSSSFKQRGSEILASTYQHGFEMFLINATNIS